MRQLLIAPTGEINQCLHSCSQRPRSRGHHTHLPRRRIEHRIPLRPLREPRRNPTRIHTPRCAHRLRNHPFRRLAKHSFSIDTVLTPHINPSTILHPPIPTLNRPLTKPPPQLQLHLPHPLRPHPPHPNRHLERFQPPRPNLPIRRHLQMVAMDRRLPPLHRRHRQRNVPTPDNSLRDAEARKQYL